MEGPPQLEIKDNRRPRRPGGVEQHVYTANKDLVSKEGSIDDFRNETLRRGHEHINNPEGGHENVGGFTGDISSINKLRQKSQGFRAKRQASRDQGRRSGYLSTPEAELRKFLKPNE